MYGTRTAAIGLLIACSACAWTPPKTTTAVPVVVVPRVVPSPCVRVVTDVKGAAAARRRLAADLRRLVSRRPGRVGVFMRDLVTGVTIGYRETVADQITASGAKVDILVTLLRQARAAKRRLSGWEKATAGDMIRHSDNRAADALYSRVGGASGVGSTYRRLGMSRTTPGPSRYWGGTRTSAADRVRLMTALVKGGKGIAAADRAYVLSLMGQVEKGQRWGVSAAARPGDTVALKNGWTRRPFINNTWAVTSYGHIKGPGRDLIIAVQSDVQPGMGAGVQTIERVSALIASRVGALNTTHYKICTARHKG